MPTLERSNPLPLYYQLKRSAEAADSGRPSCPSYSYPIGAGTCEQLSCESSHSTQALTELVHEGLLYRQHGKGTFVCEPRVQQTLSELSSFSEEIRGAGNARRFTPCQ